MNNWFCVSLGLGAAAYYYRDKLLNLWDKYDMNSKLDSLNVSVDDCLEQLVTQCYCFYRSKTDPIGHDNNKPIRNMVITRIWKYDEKFQPQEILTSKDLLLLYHLSADNLGIEPQGVYAFEYCWIGNDNDPSSNDGLYMMHCDGVFLTNSLTTDGKWMIQGGEDFSATEHNILDLERVDKISEIWSGPYRDFYRGTAFETQGHLVFDPDSLEPLLKEGERIEFIDVDLNDSFVLEY